MSSAGEFDGRRHGNFLSARRLFVETGLNKLLQPVAAGQSSFEFQQPAVDRAEFAGGAAGIFRAKTAVGDFIGAITAWPERDRTAVDVKC